MSSGEGTEGPQSGGTLALGAPVRCSDGELGELTDVVVDPRTDRVTHLVVAAQTGYGLARIVPIQLAAPAGGEAEVVTLSCTQEEFGRLEPVATFVFLALGEAPKGGEDFDVGIETAFGMPSGVDEFGGYAVASTGDVGVSYDRIPKGTREIRRASPVLSSDGHRLGHVAGLLVGPEGRITHLVLEHGHLWGRRDVTIEIGLVEQVETDSVVLSASKDDVGAMPSVRVRRRPAGR
jgi:sporulation protein YlmC with PRC-barrel domain